MALVKEDGTGVADANTYALVAEVRAYAQARGVTLPVDDSSVESLIIPSMDYLEGFRSRYQATKTYTGVAGFHANDEFEIAPPADVDTHPAQLLQWPRYGVTIDGVPISGNTMPKELIAALCQCVMEIQAGNDLNPTTSGQVVKREKVDVLETEYMTSQDLGFEADFKPEFPKVNALLAALLAAGSVLNTVRV